MKSALKTIQSKKKANTKKAAPKVSQSMMAPVWLLSVGNVTGGCPPVKGISKTIATAGRSPA